MCRKFQYYIAVVCLVFLTAGCGELTPPGERSSEAGTYTVRTGDTLYSISWGFGHDYREVASWNNITPPYLIHAGQQLVMTPPLQRESSPLPKKFIENTTTSSKVQPKVAPKTSAISPNRLPPRPSTTIKPLGNNKASSPSIEKSGNAPTHITIAWRWPTKGQVRTKFDPASGKKGIDITGRSGEPIFSAAAGDVVYSGSGLLGYGNLVIIKHDDVYLSAYGHNSQLLVKEGDKVASGQEIAKMGVSPKEGAMLHFEIRREGKPVDPSRFLPKKN